MRKKKEEKINKS